MKILTAQFIANSEDGSWELNYSCMDYPGTECVQLNPPVKSLSDSAKSNINRFAKDIAYQAVKIAYPEIVK